jgi:uncharacterized repeat protein (TIGR03803 family)
MCTQKANDFRVNLTGAVMRATAIGTIALILSASSWASQKTLYSFRGGNDGANPHASLIADSAGNLYGTTSLGGGSSSTCPNGCGTVFELVKTSTGYQEKVLYRFQGGSDGYGPWSGALTCDAAGNLYGTTNNGGCSANCFEGCGTAFKLTKGSNGQWTETVLYAFQGAPTDGQGPGGPLLFDAQGNLYGTTFYGGPGLCVSIGCGVIFQLSPTTSGPWSETLLYIFKGLGDGGIPSGPLSVDANGNLFGTTTVDGASNDGGTIFELSPSAGTWTFSTLFSFDGRVSSETGLNPDGGVILDDAGNLYGTTVCGGFAVRPKTFSPCAAGFGTVFELSQGIGGVWTEQVLVRFHTVKQEAFPDTSLIRDQAGNLYGTTFYGGDLTGIGGGTVYEVVPNGDGTWSERVLSRFLGTTLNGGVTPYSGVIRDASGNLYGTTYSRGRYGYGVVYEVIP